MSEENRAIALRWFEEVWNQRSLETIDELIAPDCIGHMEGVETRSPDDFKKIRAALLDAFPDLRVVVEETIAEGPNVVLRWRVEATHGGDGLGIKATGRPVIFRGMTQQRILGGKIVEGWDAWNQGALLAALNPAAPPVVARPRASTSPRSRARLKPKPKAKARTRNRPAPVKKKRRR